MKLMKILKNGEPQMAQQQQQPVIQMPAPQQQRQRSEAAAQAAQHWHDLETALAQAQQDLLEARAEIIVGRERVKHLQDDNATLLADRDYHKNRYTSIETSLQNCARILVDLMQAPHIATVNEYAPTTNSKIEAAKAAMEQELTATPESMPAAK